MVLLIAAAPLLEEVECFVSYKITGIQLVSLKPATNRVWEPHKHNFIVVSEWYASGDLLTFLGWFKFQLYTLKIMYYGDREGEAEIDRKGRRKGRRKKEGMRRREIFYLLVYSSNYHN